MKTSLRARVFTRPRSLGGGDLLVLSLSYSYYIIIIRGTQIYIYTYIHTARAKRTACQRET